MNRASGSRWATTIMVIHGKRNAIGATELATRRGDHYTGGNGQDQEHATCCPHLAGTPSWSTRGCAPDR
jgi:hypothetical protein